MTDKEQRDNAFRILEKIRDTAGLKQHEVVGLNEAMRILRVETETCKFNCRTVKDAYKDGACWGLGSDYWILDDFEKAAIEEAYEKWK